MNKKYASLNTLRAFLDNLKNMMNTHNVSTDSHNDIRTSINDVNTKLSALVDCDDETLDQLSEIVSYIKDNRGLIEQITTAKVSVSDIIDNLTTNVSNKPLSAAQGVALKALIDSVQISVPSNISSFINDSGYLTKTTLLDVVYPVGSIYMSANNTSPEIFLGGTWAKLENRFLLGASSSYSVGSTGGESTHKLTVDEMPSHNHTTHLLGATTSPGTSNAYYEALRSVELSAQYDGVGYVASTGGNKAHNNMPPYLAVYMWERTN